MSCENGYFVESYQAASAIVPSVGIKVGSKWFRYINFCSKNVDTFTHILCV